MKAVLQRVTHASVKVDGEIKGKIGNGLLVFLGVGLEDTEKQEYLLLRQQLHVRHRQYQRWQQILRNLYRRLFLIMRLILLYQIRTK